ncbi:MAG: hypothetical protein Q4F18_00330 [Clostridia bacterium]|nr:hypothetical protein [Clostridia bacterium]
MKTARAIRSALIICLLLAGMLPAAAACADDGIGFSFAYEEIPEQLRAECAQKGTVERIEYATYVYDKSGAAGKPGINEAYVYLPYGYDPEGAYSILYLMHGGEEHAGYWFAQGDYAAGGARDRSSSSVTLNVLDQMIASKRCEPLIVVTPCMAAEKKHGFNGTGTFRYEFKNDLVPAVESQYATFADGDTSPAGLTASRDHRGYAGLSLGSTTGWASILMGCTDYVGYIGNFSGYNSNVYAISDSMNTAYAEYPILYWYNGNGSYDQSHDDHLRAYNQMLKLCPGKLTEGTDTAKGQNCCFVDKPGKSHNYASWIIDLYNVLLVFFTCP